MQPPESTTQVDPIAMAMYGVVVFVVVVVLVVFVVVVVGDFQVVLRGFLPVDGLES